MRRIIYLVLGPLAFLIAHLGIFGDLSPDIRSVLGVTLWVAIWWITEAIPIEATALLPIVLFPATGALDVGTTTTTYFSPIVVLFFGGFVLAIAIEKWGLHKRIALSIISKVGTDGKKLILGFMLATFFLSMWISNTATTLMMLPIGLSIIASLGSLAIGNKPTPQFNKSLLLAIAYSASIGGMATLIGTPTNAIFAGMASQLYGYEVSFSRWILFGLPFGLVVMLLAWINLTRGIATVSQPSQETKVLIRNELKGLGSITAQERMVILVFSITALAWITRSFLIKPFFPMVDDTVIAIAAAVSFFVIPVRKAPLLSWEDTKAIPWGILLVFGGGLALAKGFEVSGLASWLADYLTVLTSWPFLILLFLVVLAVNFFTEITSNVATASVVLPILAALSKSIGVHPVGLMMGACLASSCAFMLPVATPPNAIVFGSGKITIREMIRAGVWLNVVSSIIITVFVYWLLPIIWDFDLFTFPF